MNQFKPVEGAYFEPMTLAQAAVKYRTLKFETTVPVNMIHVVRLGNPQARVDFLLPPEFSTVPCVVINVPDMVITIEDFLANDWAFESYTVKAGESQ